MNKPSVISDNTQKAIKRGDTLHTKFGLENLYLIHLFSRTTDNLIKLGIPQILNSIFDFIKPFPRSQFPFQINVKNNEDKLEEIFHQLLFAYLFQIILNCISYQGFWKINTLSHYRIEEIKAIARESKKICASNNLLTIIKG